MIRKAVWIGVSLVLSSIPVSGATQGAPPKAAPSPRARTPIPRLTERVIALIQDAAKGGSRYDFLPLSDSSGDSTRLFVHSVRNSIAFKTASVAESGGRYTPPSDVRHDTVLINCGDSDLGEIFECTRVTVKVRGKRIAPLAYESGTNGYSNAMGAKWRVREVSAEFAARDLKQGFTVDYAAPDGTEWTFEVSEFDAIDKLLLTVGDAASPSSQPTPQSSPGVPTGP